ncbi:DNA-(apurinic or apyrimidinic site) lyase [Paramicrosporidium saccamoebae]|uniref:DNA-(apurinic or apyrimidinic site) endonuclease 2 n=1 Tax=Paramicrosporidium saccamoebae TaxID=1246581 RepID=A0A2H9TPF8_9FUNG|nr:DNA-(apurinic or apyrimidinic site) lyase [Paramicrosporidium saccamoebae]
MRIISFNVNGLRSIREHYAISKGWTFDEFLDSLEADIICFQESKINEVAKLQREYAMPSEYTGYFTFQKAVKKVGYSGVVTYCKRGTWEPIAYEEGFTGVLSTGSTGSTGSLGNTENQKYDTDILRTLDSEGRCIITDHVHFVLIHVYFPNYSGPERTDFREKFYDALWCRCLELLRAGRSIVLLGDINVAYHPRDRCEYARAFQDLCSRVGDERAEELIRLHNTHGLDETVSANDRLVIEAFYNDRPLRSWLYRLLFMDKEAQKYGLRDVFRTFHPKEEQKYTAWNTQMAARGTNHGSRIDLILVAGPLFANGITVTNSDILPKVMGSDHCPVYMELDLDPTPITTPAVPKNLKIHHNQKRLSDFFQKKDETLEMDPEASPPVQQIVEPLADTTTALVGTKRSCTLAAKITDFFPVKTNPPASTVQDEELPDGVLEQFENNERASQDWKGIFQRKPPPLCRGHSEPCQLRTVNKTGPNRGRKFYSCARGVGNNDDPEARCGHFEWMIGAKKK